MTKSAFPITSGAAAGAGATAGAAGVAAAVVAAGAAGGLAAKTDAAVTTPMKTVANTDAIFKFGFEKVDFISWNLENMAQTLMS